MAFSLNEGKAVDSSKNCLRKQWQIAENRRCNFAPVGTNLQQSEGN